MKKNASDKLIDTVPEIPKNVESPIVKPNDVVVKPTTPEEDGKRRKKEIFKNQSDLVSPDLIYEWAARDAEINQTSLEDSVKNLIKTLELDKKIADDVWAYHDKIYNNRKKMAFLLNQTVDEVGNGFDTFQESFKYMTMDLSKRDRWQLKKYARKAGFNV